MVLLIWLQIPKLLESDWFHLRPYCFQALWALHPKPHIGFAWGIPQIGNLMEFMPGRARRCGFRFFFWYPVVFPTTMGDACHLMSECSLLDFTGPERPKDQGDDENIYSSSSTCAQIALHPQLVSGEYRGVGWLPHEVTDLPCNRAAVWRGFFVEGISLPGRL